MHRLAPVAALIFAAAACASPAPKPASAASAKPAAPAVAAAAPAAAPAQAAPAAAMPAMPKKTHKLAVIVTAVDPAAGTITAKAHGATKVYRVAEGCKFTKGGDMKAVGLKEVAKGQHLTIAYAGDVLASVHVKILAAGAPAESAVVAKNTVKPAKNSKGAK